LAWAPNCEQPIVIYQGLSFQEGESIELSIDDRILLSESFEKGFQGNDAKVIETYCCLKDSCRVRFLLGDKDTTFYVTPTKTKRLIVGSDTYGGLSVATDLHARAWVKM
jgi:ribosomal protein L21E